MPRDISTANPGHTAWIQEVRFGDCGCACSLLHFPAWLDFRTGEAEGDELPPLNPEDPDVPPYVLWTFTGIRGLVLYPAALGTGGYDDALYAPHLEEPPPVLPVHSNEGWLNLEWYEEFLGETVFDGLTNLGWTGFVYALGEYTEHVIARETSGNLARPWEVITTLPEEPSFWGETELPASEYPAIPVPFFTDGICLDAWATFEVHPLID